MSNYSPDEVFDQEAPEYVWITIRTYKWHNRAVNQLADHFYLTSTSMSSILATEHIVVGPQQNATRFLQALRHIGVPFEEI